MSRGVVTMMVLGSRACQPTFLCISNTQSFARYFSAKKLTPTITLLSNDKSVTNIKLNPTKPAITNYSSEGRPLSIMLCWLMAKTNAVNKYAQYYLDRNFDVLTVRITPWQLLWPRNADIIVKHELLPILRSSDHEDKLIHGFSVGGHIHAQMLKYFHRDVGLNAQLVSTLKAQIFDSVVDINEVSIGVSKSVFMKNNTLQIALERYIDFHMKAFYKVATCYYDESHEYFYNRPLHAPALFFCSERDQISTPDVNRNLQKLWSSKGIPTQAKFWPNTSHVGHYRKYPQEYTEALSKLIDNIGMKPRDPTRKPVADLAHDHHAVFV